MLRKESFLRDYEKKLDRAINQIELGMWYEHTERDGHAIVVCHSPTGHDYELNPACMSCNCPDTSRVHGLCKHVIGYDVWLKCHPKRIYQKVAQRPTEDRELFRKAGLVISLNQGRMVYQNGRTVTSEPVVEDGLLSPTFMQTYKAWENECKSDKLASNPLVSTHG